MRSHASRGRRKLIVRAAPYGGARDDKRHRRGRLAGRPGHNKGRRYPAEILSASEARALVRASSPRSPTGLRNRALVVVLYRGGLRLAEALALAPADVDAAAGSIRVLHGKGDRARTVGIDPAAAGLVAAWAARRRSLGIGPRGPLFCTLDGGPLQQQYVRTMLGRLRARAGITKRVHPDGLRHTHAAELAAEGWPANLIQTQLGHASLATTDRYLRHIAPRALLEAARRREWAA